MTLDDERGLAAPRLPEVPPPVEAPRPPAQCAAPGCAAAPFATLTTCTWHSDVFELHAVAVEREARAARRA